MFEASSSPAIPGNTRIGSSLLLISRFSWAIVSTVGCFGLLGWVFNFASFKQIMPGLATMKANTALCFILAGAALAGLHTEHRRQPIRWAGRLCAGAVVMIAVLTLIEYVVGWNLGIDQFLFADTDSVVFPGRMSIVTALSFSLLGLALLLLDYQRAYWLVNMLVVLALLTAWIALIGYIYGVASLYRVLPFSTIAVHTAANLIILSIGMLFARPSYGLAALIASDSAGGLMARRLLPVAVFIPLLLGWLRWEGQLAGLYDTEFGLMIMVVVTTVGFVAFIWWNAKSLDRLELGRLRIAEALHNSEERFRATFEQAAVGIAHAGLQGQCLQVNQKLCDIVGYTRAELLGRTFQAITYPDDLDADLAYAGRMLAGEIQTYSMEKRYIRKDDTLVWINLTVSLVRESSGEPKYFISVVEDISDRKRAEAAQNEAAERLGGIVGSAMDAIVSIDEARNIVLFNAAAEQMFRCSASATIGQSIDQFVPVHLRDRHVTHVQTFGAIGATRRTMRSLGTLTAVRADGEEFPIEATISQIVVAGQKTYTVIVRDITERKRVEVALLESEERLRAVTETARVGLVIVDREHRYRYANRAYAQIFHLPTFAIAGLRVADVLASVYEDQIRPRLERAFRGEHVSYELVVPPAAPGGEQQWYAVTYEPSMYRSETVVVEVVLDISERKRAEAALRQSEERFAKAFHASPAALTITRISDGCFIDMNESFERLLGYRREELIDHSSSDLNMFTTPDERAELVRRLREHGFVHDYETTLRTQSGEVRNVLFSTEAIDLEGEACIIALLFDITDRKRAEHAIQRYTERLKHLRQIDQAMLANRSLEEIAQAALAHIWQMIPCTRASIVLVDMAAETITLFAVQVNGEPRVPPGLQAPVAIIGEAFDLLKQGQVYQVPDIAALPEPPPTLHAAQVERVRAYVYVPIISDTELLGMLCLGSDQPGVFPDESIDIAMELAGQLAIAIDQARLRAQIEHHAVELEQRVAERTAELAAANHELEAFSYSVSHDLRAPLRAIAGFSRILIEEYLPELPDEARDYLLLVRDNAKRMDHLINELLAFARLGRQALNKQLLAPAELVRQIIMELSGEQAEREVEFVIADLPICSADPALLRQVYVNLLANALKFTSKRAAARIEVGVQTTPERPNETVYFVEDNGAGFDMRYAGKLFGVFQRLHRAEDYEGTGVGLAIVQRVIHRHGGRVWAEAAVDRGATFYFTLGDSGNYV